MSNAGAAALDTTVVAGDIVQRVAGIVAVTLFKKGSQEDVANKTTEGHERKSKVSLLRPVTGMNARPRTCAWRKSHGACCDDGHAPL